MWPEVRPRPAGFPVPRARCREQGKGRTGENGLPMPVHRAKNVQIPSHCAEIPSKSTYFARQIRENGLGSWFPISWHRMSGRDVLSAAGGMRNNAAKAEAGIDTVLGGGAVVSCLAVEYFTFGLRQMDWSVRCCTVATGCPGCRT